jgi:hypothetical protein
MFQVNYFDDINHHLNLINVDHKKRNRMIRLNDLMNQFDLELNLMIEGVLNDNVNIRMMYMYHKDEHLYSMIN